MNKHTIWMIIGCTIPLLLIFLAPALGISGNVSFFIFIAAMFACHLLMPMHHAGHANDEKHKHSQLSKPENNESH